MSFQGSLNDLPLPDILQLLEGSVKTGRLRIRHEERCGEIYVRQGRIIHAECGELRGESGIFEIATWSEGGFDFCHGVECQHTTIERDKDFLMMEAARRIDEWRVIAQHIPSLDRVPSLAEITPTGPVSLGSNEWRLARTMDGHRSISELKRMLGVETFDICKSLFVMLKAGLVELSVVRPTELEPSAEASRVGAHAA